MGRRAPRYWWEFKHRDDGTMFLVIESDDSRLPDPVARFADTEIAAAERLIADLSAGRADPRRCA